MAASVPGLGRPRKVAQGRSWRTIARQLGGTKSPYPKGAQEVVCLLRRLRRGRAEPNVLATPCAAPETLSWKKIAKQIGLGVGTLYRVSLLPPRWVSP